MIRETNSVSKDNFASWRTVVAVTLFLDFIGGTLVFLVRPEYLSAIPSGFAFGQFGLAAMWGVFGPGRWFLRWVGALASAAGLLAAFLFWPLWIHGNGLRETFAGALLLPSLLFAAQLPLFALRLLGGNRLTARDAPWEQPDRSVGQFRIIDLLGAITVCAIVLASLETARVLLPEYVERHLWPGNILIECLAFVSFGALILLPCLWARMLAKNRNRATIMVAGWITFWPLILVAVLCVVSPDALSRTNGLFFILLFSATLAATLLSGLRLTSGYVLLRPSESPRVAATEVMGPEAARAVLGLFYIGATIAAPVVLLWSVHRGDSYVCERTGSKRSRDIWFDCVVWDTYSQSPLEDFLQRDHPELIEHKWVWAGGVETGVLGDARVHEDSFHPALHLPGYLDSYRIE